MADRAALLWQARTWGRLLRAAAGYPLRNRPERAALVDAHTAVAREYLPVRRLDVFTTGLDDAARVTVSALETRDHNCSLLELYSLATLVRVVQPRRILEIGTYDGRTILAMAENAPEGAEVFTLNLPPGHVADASRASTDALLSQKVASGERAFAQPAGATVTQLFGDSNTFDFTPYAKCGVIFIDGAHDAGSAMSDSRNALELIDRENGVVAWHDATSFGVRQVTQQLLAEGLPLRRIAGTDIAVLRFADRHAVEL